MFAVIVDGGRQYRVEKGNQIRFDFRVDAKPDDPIRFDEILLAGTKAASKIGKPTLEGAIVEGKVIKQQLGKKLEITRFKRRKKIRRHTGHRQKYTTVEITAITIPGLADDAAAT